MDKFEVYLESQIAAFSMFREKQDLKDFATKTLAFYKLLKNEQKENNPLTQIGKMMSKQEKFVRRDKPKKSNFDKEAAALISGR